VVIARGEMRLAAPRVRVVYLPDRSGIETLEASGGVTLTSGEDAAEARDAAYNLSTGMIELRGNVLLVQGANAISGDTVIVDTNAGTAQVTGRVRTILRRGRGGGLDSNVMRVADLELDLLRRRVTRGGKRIDLTAKEFGLLELLMRRQGEVLPRSLIASQVWDMNFDSDTNVIEVAMRRLRLKVDDGQSVKLIQTVRGMGYVLEAAQEP
jgi:DNA-binding winged helix-turn-helix (wHTH) protein